MERVRSVVSPMLFLSLMFVVVAEQAGATTGCGEAETLIHDIQGSGATSPLVGNALTIEGVVVGDFQTSAKLSGFFVQEEDAEADADPNTSEGIFVFDGGSPSVAVSVGDMVRVDGTVTEFNGLTEITSVSSINVCSSGNALPAPASVILPFASSTEPEKYEGMYVAFSQTLTVSENLTLARFGELVLSSGGRLMTPTNVVAPGAPAIVMQAANDLNRITLDDGSNIQNPRRGTVHVRRAEHRRR